MEVPNPLVPPQVGAPGAAPSPVANAPNVPDATKHETARPVTASGRSERPETQDNPPPESRQEKPQHPRGQVVDVSV